MDRSTRSAIERRRLTANFARHFLRQQRREQKAARAQRA
jgi:hypothetical protein